MKGRGTMENYINITQINDYIFCPVSIYFHNVYGKVEPLLYHEKSQLQGKNAHETIDEGTLKQKNKISGIDVYCEELNLIGKIDIYDINTKKLIERKRQIKKIYDGYIFQLYAQYYCMTEMGYEVDCLELYSMVDKKTYEIMLPKENIEMDSKFKETIFSMYEFDIEAYKQNNKEKCRNCIYESACDRSIL